jgi:DNA polymerase III subunit chi
VTEVAFHFGAPDKVAYASRLLRKVNAAGMRTMAVADPATLAQLDVALWGVSQTDFVPHVGPDGAEAIAKRSAVLLAPVQPKDSARCAVLVNLGDEVPSIFDQFERVIEVVSTHDDDRGLARERWKHYTRLGYTIARHDLKLRENAG